MSNDKSSLSAITEALEKAAKYDHLQEELGTVIEAELKAALIRTLKTPTMQKIIEQGAKKEIDNFLENYDVTDDDTIRELLYTFVQKILTKELKKRTSK